MVIGAGAAGLMCAIEAGRRGREVLVLERNPKAGMKILISGGGRCNFTNLNVTAANYLTSGSPDFCKSALARYTPADFIAWVEREGIRYHEKKLGQLFCDVSSREIVDLLLREAAQTGVRIRTGCEVREVRKPLGFEVETSTGPVRCASLVVATGGLSFPKLGATDLGLRLARDFGLEVIPPRPGLVPVTFAPEDQSVFGALSGLSVEVVARAGGTPFRENLLFTHRGLSGPAILQASSYDPSRIRVDLLPDHPGTSLLEPHRTERRELRTALGRWLPNRMAEAWCTRHRLGGALHTLTPKQREGIVAALHDWEIRPEGTEGYAKAEVMVGGVSTAELSSKGLESRRVPGLHFAGEVVDVTGWLGGYNFQWAWSSGHAVGRLV